ncbi:hypothetical protein [Mariniluteicoccus flavus]
MLVVVLSWAAATLSILANLPQLLRLVRVRTAAGLSLVSWQAIAACGLGWTLHGGVLKNATIVVPNFVLMLSAATIVGLIARHRSVGLVRAYAPVAAVGALMFAIGQAWGPVAFAVAAFLPGLIGLIAQAVDLVRSTHVTGVSLSALLFQVLTQATWFAWALATHEPSVTIVATVIGLAYVVNVVLYLIRAAAGAARETPSVAAA